MPVNISRLSIAALGLLIATSSFAHVLHKVDPVSPGKKYAAHTKFTIRDIQQLNAGRSFADTPYIANQNTQLQTGNFAIGGIGRADGGFISNRGTASAGNIHLRFQTKTKERWGLGLIVDELTDNSNTGSDFTLWRYADNGNYLSAIFRVKRSTGVLNFTYNPTVGVNNDVIWHAGNDGAGSTLDADLLDGLQGDAYARTTLLAPTFDSVYKATAIRQGSFSSVTNGGSSNIADAPIAGTAAAAISAKYDQNFGFQITNVVSDTANLYYRVRRNGNFGPWKKLSNNFSLEGIANQSATPQNASFNIKGNSTVDGYTIVKGPVAVPIIQMQENTSATPLRWGLGMLNNLDVNNAGQDFVLRRYDNTGVFMDAPFIVTRKDGNVGIGTLDTKGYKLAVNGNVIANKITVKAFPWADFVFDDNYKLPTLASIESFIKQHKHLPNIPSAKEVAEKGIEVGEMNSKLLQTIEEITLHVIAQEKQINSQQSQLVQQQKLIDEQQKAMQLMMEKLEKLTQEKK
ncbi:putative coiled-coil protein SlyX [Chitinophaga skermanii]|uniref:Putative coiled-coil protein SlyX n=1 Tax=Chitinophaga skermanii TaxID=331697 RepID=A0A327Q576_9BACT|nr:hypothetical protein [Chitinophaga skermanii]RAI99470.1 putative coiled-coil protein SlyX [Chitinophaga skermanii]